MNEPCLNFFSCWSFKHLTCSTFLIEFIRSSSKKLFIQLGSPDDYFGEIIFGLLDLFCWKKPVCICWWSTGLLYKFKALKQKIRLFCNSNSAKQLTQIKLNRLNIFWALDFYNKTFYFWLTNIK